MSPTNKTTAKSTGKTTSARTTGAKSGSVDATGKNLVIVESPTKARTLNRYLGAGFTVLASGGHIIDLPPKKFGVNIAAGFKPQFEMLPSRKKIAGQLISAAEKASAIYLATDPDREGEAIAWHIKSVIARRTKNGIYRVQFHEITKTAVTAAMKNPGEIDPRKVDAQLARRIMDRLVGYQVSPILWKTVTGGLSAGRVQSVALRIICEREAAIAAFVKEEYWTIDGSFSGEKVNRFNARLSKLDGEKAAIPNEDTAKSISQRLEKSRYRVLDITTTRKRRQPYPPYITSTLQQDGGRRLGYPVKRTMALAQQLYEGVELGERGLTGLITYMRTDSTRVANEAVVAVRDWIASEYGHEFVADRPRVFKNKKGPVQDAHEAIRPTDVRITPEIAGKYLTPELGKLYELIWRRFVATQMAEADIDLTVVTIGDGDSVEFRTTGQTIRFPGFLSVYADVKTEEDKEEETSAIPPGLTVGLPLNLEGLDSKQHFTQPPPRFNEASLVKELDENGIGRPSTYATIITTLLDRKYVDRQNRSFLPTDLGQTVNRILIDRFPDIFNIEFTARMEDELDKIETGEDKLKVLQDFYGPFDIALKAAEKARSELRKEAAKPVGRQCPKCGGELVYRWGRFGQFISCSSFPKCKYSENLESTPTVEVDTKCPKCGSPMVVREGRYGRFLSCSQYPKCRGILPLTTGLACPVEGCSGHLSERKTKKGRTFFGCSRYPDCKFTSWDKPTAGPCPQCTAPTLFVKTSKSGESTICHRCDWKKTE
jgi:DNA topoisomerase-1